MNLAGLSLIKVDDSTTISSFDCENEDLNDFLASSAKDYTREYLATTYLLKRGNDIIAYFSIFNDSIRAEERDFPSKSALKKFLKIVSHRKRHLNTFPAIKIGRLAVCNSSKLAGIGTIILNYVIDMGITQNEKCACKFISVDAYKGSIEFYKKKQFVFLTEKDSGKDTRQMYLDLTPYINAINAQQAAQESPDINPATTN